MNRNTDLSQKVPIVIPAYEPDEALIALCDALNEANLHNIILVDDGGGEAYRAIFDRLEERNRCRILRHAVNLGKGRALKDAFNCILNEEPDAVGCVTADSDGQHTPQDIRRCMEALLLEPNALVLGCRQFGGEDVPWKSRFGNELTRKVCRFLYGLNVSDTQTGLRGIPRDFMAALLPVAGERFEFETNMLIACGEETPIREITIETVYDSKDDHRTHFDPVKDSMRIYTIFGKRFIQYAFSSFSASLIDLVLFTLLCSLFKDIGILSTGLRWNMPLYVAVATVIARVVSAAYNYLITYSLVFHSKKNRSRSVTRYTLLAAIQMGLSTFLVTGGVWLLPFMPETVVKIIVDTALFFVGYLIQRKYVF